MPCIGSQEDNCADTNLDWQWIVPPDVIRSYYFRSKLLLSGQLHKVPFMIVPFSPLINEEINVFDILKESWIEDILHTLSFTPKSLIFRCPWITVVFFLFFMLNLSVNTMNVVTTFYFRFLFQVEHKASSQHIFVEWMSECYFWNSGREEKS